MRLTWVGHSCFLAEGRGDNGGPLRVLMDPYRSPGCGTYGPVDLEADVVTVSHSYDALWHGDLEHVHGDPAVLEDLYGESAEAGGVRFESHRTHHTSARERPNTTLWFTLDDLRVAHLGDLGHPLTAEEVEAMQPVDIVLAPASGVYVIEPRELLPVLEALDPAVVVPMHFRNDRIDLGMRPVDDLLELVDGSRGWEVAHLGTSTVDVDRGTLPGDGPEVWVLEHLR